MSRLVLKTGLAHSVAVPSELFRTGITHYKYSRERSLEAPDIAEVGADTYCLFARGVTVALLAASANCWYIGFPCAGARAGGTLSTPN